MRTTRRNVLKGGGKAVAAAAVLPLIASSATSSGAAGIDPFEYLAKEWLDRKAGYARIHKAWKAAYDTLPKWARDGKPPTAHFGPIRGFYTVDYVKDYRDKELPRIKEAADKKAFRERCARLIAARQEYETKHRLADDRAGVTELNAQCEAAGERVCEIEDRIVETPTASLLGIVVKLRVAWADLKQAGELVQTDKAVKGALDGAEILLAQTRRAI